MTFMTLITTPLNALLLIFPICDKLEHTSHTVHDLNFPRDMQPQPSWEGHHTAASSSHPLHYRHYPAPASQGAGYENYEQYPPPRAPEAPYIPYSRSRSTGGYDCYHYEQQGFPGTDGGTAGPLEQEPMGSYTKGPPQDQRTSYGRYDESGGTDQQGSYSARGTLDHKLCVGSEVPGASQFRDQQFQTEFPIPVPSASSYSSEVPTSSHHSGISVDQDPLGCHGDESLEQSYSRSEYENSFFAKAQKFVMRNAEVLNALTQEPAKMERALTLHEATGEESCESSCKCN